MQVQILPYAPFNTKLTRAKTVDIFVCTMYKCKYCNQEFDNPRKLSGHATWCDLNPNVSKNRSTCKVNNKFINQVKASFHCAYCKQDLLMTATQFGLHNRWCNPNTKYSNCKFCNKEFDSKKISGHINWCDLNPNKSKNLENLSSARSSISSNNENFSKEIQLFNCQWCKQDLTLTSREFKIHVNWCEASPKKLQNAKRLELLRSKINKASIEKRAASIKEAHKRGAYKASNAKRSGVPGKKHSAETRKLLSEKRKAYLAKNKSNHSWSRYNNVESKPEKIFRLFAEKTNIPLVQYYIPPESNRFFEMDFANLEHKICFEINGNQHYLEDRKTLAPYYQNRHDHFVSLGWKVLEIHYALCFNEANIETILKESFVDFQKCEEKIQRIANGRIERREKKLEKKREEGKKLQVDFTQKPHTQKEINYFFKQRKVTRPSKEELHQMLWSMPSTKIALHFGVSSKCIEKWANGYGLSKPPRGHWMKEAAKKKK